MSRLPPLNAPNPNPNSPPTYMETTSTLPETQPSAANIDARQRRRQRILSQTSQQRDASLDEKNVNSTPFPQPVQTGAHLNQAFEPDVSPIPQRLDETVKSI